MSRTVKSVWDVARLDPKSTLLSEPQKMGTSRGVGMSREYEAIRTYYTTVNDRDDSVLDFRLNYERGMPVRSRRGDAPTGRSGSG